MLNRIMLEKILNLGPQIESINFNKDDFPLLCHKAIEAIEIDKDLQEFNAEISQFLLKGNLPNQLNVYNHFGQPPVTLFNNGEFVVDLYFWMEADTSIHSHSFSGAFKVLYGNSKHNIYNTEERTKYSDDIILNEINLIKSENLTAGDSREIISGNSLGHSFRSSNNKSLHKNDN